MQTQLSQAHGKPERNQRANPNPNKCRSQTLICRVWIRFLWKHILLMVNLSFTSLKITRQLSRLLSKEEVQRWDMFRGHTELRWIGCSTESIQIPRSKSNMLTPKTNWQTCCPKEDSRVTNGTIFCTCSTSWNFRHILAATSFVQTGSRVWCRKGLKDFFQTIRQRWRRNKNRWILCLIETCLLRVRILKTRVTLKSRGATEQANCLQASGNRSKVAQMKVRFFCAFSGEVKGKHV